MGNRIPDQLTMGRSSSIDHLHATLSTAAAAFRNWSMVGDGCKSTGGSSNNSLSSVAQSCLTLCDPVDCSTPGFPVHHQLPELVQTHVHRVGEAIQPSHPLLSPSPPTFNLSQHQGLFQWVSSSHQVAKQLAKCWKKQRRGGVQMGLYVQTTEVPISLNYKESKLPPGSTWQKRMASWGGTSVVKKQAFGFCLLLPLFFPPWPLNNQKLFSELACKLLVLEDV